MARNVLFYRNGWHQAVDKQLIYILKRQRFTGMSHRVFDSDLAPDFLKFLTEELNYNYQSKFSEATVQDQVHTLKMCYMVFEYIIKDKGFVWDNANVLWATDRDWPEIVSVHPLAAAYRDEKSGEEEWDDLEKFFGEEVPEEESEEMDDEDFDYIEIDDGEIDEEFGDI